PVKGEHALDEAGAVRSPGRHSAPQVARPLEESLRAGDDGVGGRGEPAAACIAVDRFAGGGRLIRCEYGAQREGASASRGASTARACGAAERDAPRRAALPRTAAGGRGGRDEAGGGSSFGVAA